MAGPEEIVVTIDQLAWQQPVTDQLLLTIDVGQYCIEQTRTLGDARGQFLPLGGRNQVRQQIQFPGAVGAFGVGINAVSDAVFAELASQ
ncbi:hypothetical protein D3C77_529020 [compost metagenome]